MDKTMTQEEGAQAPAVLAGLGKWAARVRALSPQSMAERLRVDAEAAVVATQIIACLKKPRDSEYAQARMEAAWTTYGPEPFKAAMGQRVWSAAQPSNKDDTPDPVRLIAPAEAAAMLAEASWARRLGDMVPQKMWERRTEAAMAWGWPGDYKVLAEAGIWIKSVGPLMRLCSQADKRLDPWQASFAALCAHLPVPTKLEELACRALLANAGDSRLSVFCSWLESAQIKEHVGEPATAPARAARRI